MKNLTRTQATVAVLAVAVFTTAIAAQGSISAQAQIRGSDWSQIITQLWSRLTGGPASHTAAPSMDVGAPDSMTTTTVPTSIDDAGAEMENATEDSQWSDGVTTYSYDNDGVSSVDAEWEVQTYEYETTGGTELMTIPDVRGAAGDDGTVSGLSGGFDGADGPADPGENVCLDLSCGNGTCDDDPRAREDEENCPQDCGEDSEEDDEAVTCSDLGKFGFCGTGLTPSSCEGDLKREFCGGANCHLCDLSDGPPGNQQGRCYRCPVCGDDQCEKDLGENVTNCYADCHCPDGICAQNETSNNCSADCPFIPMCGNGRCETTYSCTGPACPPGITAETSANCAADCQ